MECTEYCGVIRASVYEGVANPFRSIEGAFRTCRNRRVRRLLLGNLSAKQERLWSDPRPQILNEPKSLYQSLSGTSFDSIHKRS